MTHENNAVLSQDRVELELVVPRAFGEIAQNEARMGGRTFPPENSLHARSLHDDRVLGDDTAGDLVAVSASMTGVVAVRMSPHRAWRLYGPRAADDQQREPMKQSSSTTTGTAFGRSSTPPMRPARQVHVPCDLRARCDGRPRVDQRAAVDVGADVA